LARAERFVVYNLRETYHELGKFEFKVVLDPRYFKNGHLSEVVLSDSDGKPMKYDVQKWGRKINCTFFLDKTVADGVSNIKMVLRDDEGYEMTARSSFWVIKP